MTNADMAAFNRCIDFMVRMIEKYGSNEVDEQEKKAGGLGPLLFYFVKALLSAFRDAIMETRIVGFVLYNEVLL